MVAASLLIFAGAVSVLGAVLSSTSPDVRTTRLPDLESGF